MKSSATTGSMTLANPLLPGQPLLTDRPYPGRVRLLALAFLVPAFAQHAIAQHVPLSAVRAVAPRRAELQVREVDAHRLGAADLVPEQGRQARSSSSRRARTGSCTAGKEKTFQLAGVKVYWGHTATEQQAWRCVVDPSGHQVKLVAATSLPPTKFADVGLGTIVASAHRIT